MPTVAPMIDTAAKIAGIRTEYAKTYLPRYKGSMDSFVKYFMDVSGGNTIQNQTETFGYVESVRGARLIKRGEVIPKSGTKTISYTANIKEYGGGIDAYHLSLKYDNLKVLLAGAQGMATKNALVTEKVLVSHLTGTADRDVIDVIKNAPDGAATYATTAGGSNRFGISSGNLLSGHSVSTPQGIRTAIYAVTTQYAGMLDTVGDQMWDSSTLDQGIFIVHSSADEHNFAKATEQSMMLEYIAAATTGTDDVGGAVSNIFKDANRKVKRFGTQCLATGSWYAVLMGISEDQKPFAKYVGNEFQERYYNGSNDRESFETGYESMNYRGSFMWVVNMPLATIKVTT